MKTRRIAMITKLWLALVVVLILLPYGGTAKSTATLDEQLREAARRGDSSLVKTLLETGADVNAKDKDGKTALMDAAVSGSLSVSEQLLTRGADVDAKMAGDGTALMAASFRGHLDVVRLLLEKGADVNAADSKSWTALLFASRQGHLDVGKLLLDKGADVNAKGPGGWTPLLYAAQRNELGMLKLLVDKGADINTKGPEGRSPLMWAAQKDQLELVKWFLDGGADINATEIHGWTALMYAAIEGHFHIARVLLERGADINAKDAKGMTALMWAATDGRTDIVNILSDKGADVNLRNYWGNTAYTIASQNGHTQIAELLKNATSKSNRLVIIVGTVKLVAILIILAIIIRIGDDRPLDQPFFEDQKWSLNDAYKIAIPVLALVYLQFILHHVLTEYRSFLSTIFGPLYCVTIYGGYYFFIKKAYGARATVFGLDTVKFLKSGVRNANIAIILSLLVIILQPKEHSVYIVPAFSPFANNWAPDALVPGANQYLNVYLVVLIVFVIPVLEELLFRGILFTPVARRIGMWKAIGLLTVLGALWHLHFNVVETIRGAVLWFLFYLIYMRSTSLYGSIIWHMAANFIGFVLLGYAGILESNIGGNSLNKYYICGLAVILLIVNLVWLIAFLKRPHSERIPAKTIGKIW